MGFDETQQSSDIVYQSDQIKIVVELENLKYLENLTIDYSEDLMGGGFRFQNPNTTQSCSCGHSFVAKSQ
jgi:iron-sulfur cluster assembly accessory protein